jgi:hypothetical protein
MVIDELRQWPFSFFLLVMLSFIVDFLFKDEFFNKIVYEISLLAKKRDPKVLSTRNLHK